MSDEPKADKMRYKEAQIRKVENGKKEFEFKNKHEL